MYVQSGQIIPNCYNFSSIDEFVRSRRSIEPTESTWIPFTQKRRLNGLAYVFFTHRLAFNYRQDKTADISDINSGTNSFPVNSQKKKWEL